MISQIWGYSMWNPFANKTVAVVGNALSLFDKSHGELIDKNEIVCRFNAGNEITDSEHQGERVDISFFSVAGPVSGGSFEFEEVINGLEMQAVIVHVSSKFREKSMATHYIPVESNEEISELAGVDRPSAGLMALHYISQCNPKEINIFGFDFKETPTYYATGRTYEPHDYEAEKEYIMNTFLNVESYMCSIK